MSAAKFIPSMFHRRLALLLALVALSAVLLSVQVVNLTVVQGAERREEAEKRLVRRQWTGTTRGNILDRKGRVLAQERPSYDVAVEYPMITGAWAQQRAGRTARRLHRAEWGRLSEEERARLVDDVLPVYVAHADAMWMAISAATGRSMDDLVEARAKVIDQVEAVRGSVIRRRWVREIEAALARGRELTEDDQEQIGERLNKQEIEQQKGSHAVAARISDDAAFALLRTIGQKTEFRFPREGDADFVDTVDTMPGLSVTGSHDRDYPTETVRVDIDPSTFPSPLRALAPSKVTVEGLGVHILGWMSGTIGKDQMDARTADLERNPVLRSRAVDASGVDRGRYMTGDAVGRSGVEQSCETWLRGLRGLSTENLETGEITTMEPEPGRDLRLTLDASLQARIQAVMSPEAGLAVVRPWHVGLNEDPNPMMPDGSPINGAAVVLDIDSGEILAMVSTPTFSRRTLREHPERVFENPVDVPYLDRAISRPYPPGSIAKALILTQAITAGRLTPESTIECTGHLLPGRTDMYRCWIYKHSSGTQVHGPLECTDAVMVSCNIFFFTLGQRLGPEGITAAYRNFGLLEPWGLGVGRPGYPYDEYPGTLGKSGDGSDLSIGDAIQMGIGQGPVAWTPLHAADAYATIARGGVRLKPRIIATPLPGRSEPGEMIDLQLDKRGVEAALEGLRKSVNEQRGTGNHIKIPAPSGEGVVDERTFNAPGVQVWGKTGTADASPIVVDADGEGPEPRRVVRDGDHSWFVVLVGRAGDRPRYSIAVMMEYAGSGGRVSGPIANQVIHALIAEGYL